MAKTVEALDLYRVYRAQGEGPVAATGGRIQIHGTVTKTGPDPYALPSVELAGDKEDTHSRVLCVLPLKDYLKLRHVRRGDDVVIEGRPIGYVAGNLDYVVVKQSKIITINRAQQK